jgi:hypothetical protein
VAGHLDYNIHLRYDDLGTNIFKIKQVAIKY